MNNEYRPLVPVNPQGLDDVALALLNEKREDDDKKDKDKNQQPTRAVSNPESYILLPGKTHGTYSYPDLVVSMHRLGYSADVDKAVKWMRQNNDWKNLQLKNSQKEADGTDYIGNMNWNIALTLNKKIGNMTLNPRQFIDFKELLEAGIAGKSKVHNGLGKKIDEPLLTAVYNEICEVRDPWRSEWLDAAFSEQNGALYITTDHNLQGYNLKGRPELLEDHVSEDSWIDVTSFNRQGLPTKKSRAQKLYYYSPVAGRVARFYANSNGASLGCYGNPTDSNSSLGVRPVRKKI